jgi:protein-S-isoprenylcysteine O-methyltransferase Ste14
MNLTPHVVFSLFKVSIGIFWFAIGARFDAADPAWFNPDRVVLFSWLLLAAYWLVAGFSVKRTAKHEPSVERMVHILYMVIGALLLYDQNLPGSFLYRRFLPEDIRLAWMGAAIAFLGALFAIWARWTIGKDWSAEVQIKHGHELIRTGPYGRIRHPIYTGLLTAVAGTAIVTGQVRSILGFLIILTGFIRKAKKEESFLYEKFGPAFTEHLRHTGFFTPRLR